MALIPSQVIVPYRDQVLDDDGLLTRPWQSFFRFVQAVIDPLGVEQSFELVNNQASAADVVGLQLNGAKTSTAIIEYIIQRITTSTGATELVEAGVKQAVFKPVSNSWSLLTIGTPGPSASGVTLSITSLGQVQYTSSNITGTALISKFTYRVRSMGAKSASFSIIG